MLKSLLKLRLRGKRCSSDMIPYTARIIADIRGLDVQNVVNTATENAEEMFNVEVL